MFPHAFFSRPSTRSRSRAIQPRHNNARLGAFTPYQEVMAGEGFGSTNPTRLNFGLGGRSSVDSLKIRWPDGSRERIPSPPINKWFRIAGGTGTGTPE